MANKIYGATAYTGGAEGAVDAIDGAVLVNGDPLFAVVAGVFTPYYLNATSGAAESSPDIIAPDANAGTKRWIKIPTTLSMPMGHLSGLALSHAADTDHDIITAAGDARDATNAVDMTLSSAITKRFDAEWTVGSTNGGFAAGEALPVSGTVHVWLIKRSDTGVVDVFANNNATTGLSPTLPANYGYKRLIGSYRTDGSSNILNGDWWGTGVLRTFMFDVPVLDVNTHTPGTSAVTATLSTPAGIICKAILNIFASDSAIISSLNNTDGAASGTDVPLSNAYYASQVFVFTNTSSQVRYRMISDAAMHIATCGYEMSL